MRKALESNPRKGQQFNAARRDGFDVDWPISYDDVRPYWIRALGARIAKVHLEDFHLDRPNGRFAWTNIGDGDIDWREVRRAFDDAGYRGYFTTEVAAGDAAYLKDLAGRVDRFLSGQKPV